MNRRCINRQVGRWRAPKICVGGWDDGWISIGWIDRRKDGRMDRWIVKDGWGHG